MTDTDIMPFGKHKGLRLEQVPPDYLLWLWDNGVWAQRDHVLHSYIRDSMSALEQDAPDVIVKHPVK